MLTGGIIADMNEELEQIVHYFKEKRGLDFSGNRPFTINEKPSWEI